LHREDVAYQVVLDLKFRAIDKEVKKAFAEMAQGKKNGYTPAQMSEDIDKKF